MPQSNEGVLLVIGALFLLLGLLGGGFEVSALKFPPIGKFTRAAAVAIGAVVFGAGMFRLLFPLPPAAPLSVVVLQPTAVPPSPQAPTNVPAPPTALPPTATSAPTLILPTSVAVVTKLPISARIDDINVEYDVTRFERVGMVIQVKLRLTGLKDVPCQAVAYFHDRAGAPLVDQNGTFTTVDGNVSTFTNFTPGYEDTEYNPLEIFLPYDELELGTGVHELKFDVNIFDTRATDKALAVSPYVDFDFRK